MVKGKTRGQELIEAAEEALRFARGEETGARISVVEVPDVPAMRKKLGFTQQEFAARFGVSIGTLRNWEQRIRLPEGPARILLRVIDKNPDAVRRALKDVEPMEVKISARKRKPVRKAAKSSRRERKRA